MLLPPAPHIQILTERMYSYHHYICKDVGRGLSRVRWALPARQVPTRGRLACTRSRTRLRGGAGCRGVSTRPSSKRSPQAARVPARPAGSPRECGVLACRAERGAPKQKIHSWILNALCKHGLCRPRASCAELLSQCQETMNTETKERGRPSLSKVTAGASRRAPRMYITSVGELLHRPPG